MNEKEPKRKTHCSFCSIEHWYLERYMGRKICTVCMLRKLNEWNEAVHDADKPPEG